MSDKLKKFVEENRQSFEVFNGDYDTWWNEIDDRMKLNEEKSTSSFAWKNLMRIAATILLILTIGIAFLWVKGGSNKYANGVSLHDLSPELAEAEVYYNQLVESKLELIRASNVDVDALVVEDFKMLDSAYNELKMDLEDNMYNEEVIDAMIQNYRIKLQILENVLEEIKKSKDDEDEDNDKESIST